MPDFIHDLLFAAARRTPRAPALVHQQRRLDYAALACAVDQAAQTFLECGLPRGGRVAVFLDKCPEAVAAMFGAAAAGGVFVPINPLLKPEQAAHILADCAVCILVTSRERLASLAPLLERCPALATALVVASNASAYPSSDERVTIRSWPDADPAPTTSLAGTTAASATAATSATSATSATATPHAIIDTDVAAILYTSGSTGKPKGVVLSHRNLVAGATSVASYLGNTADDRLLSVLPLSFDYGLSQLTTAFHVGACVVLLNYLLPRDILKAVQAERITGLAAVPPLWRQIAALPWPADCSLRYLTNSGGAMPHDTLAKLRQSLPQATPFLMYGLTEAFRSTYLPPCELDRRPGSIGKAIPNAEVLVLRPDGTRCAVDEPGELVHRGPLVALGYWNDPAKSAERFRPLPAQEGLPFPERAVWSGDTVRADADGFLYYLSRADEMIKSSGYRISPTEVEEVLYADPRVVEAVALGVPHPALGQAIVVVASLQDGAHADADSLLAACRARLPGFMMPSRLIVHDGSLPRNPNGKIDRALLRAGLQDIFMEAAS